MNGDASAAVRRVPCVPRLCQLLVAKGVPAKDVPTQSWMAQHHWGHLVDQAAPLRLESLGVPVRWEAEPDTRSRSATERTVSRTADIAGAATIGLVRKFIDPRNLPSLEQAEAHDQSAENLTGHWLCGQLGYIAASAEWLTVAHAKS